MLTPLQRSAIDWTIRPTPKLYTEPSLYPLSLACGDLQWRHSGGIHEEVFTRGDLAGDPQPWNFCMPLPVDLSGGLHWWPEAFSISGCLGGSLRGPWKTLRTVYVTVQQRLHSILIKFGELLLYCEKPTLSLDHPVDTWRKAYDGDVDVVLSTISPKQSLNIVILWYLRLLLLLSDVSRPSS